MPQVQKTVTIQFGPSEVLIVDQCSKTVQQLVAILDEWRQEQSDASSKALMVQAALRDLQRELFDTITREKAAAAAAAAAEAAKNAPAPVDAPVDTAPVDKPAQ